MRYSHMFGKSTRATSKDIQSKGHAYLLRGGYLRESAAGRFYTLPLGMKVQEKVCRIVEEEMDNLGAQRILAPILHPRELWEETRRSESTSFGLMQVRDRNERAFVLGGTAEEMMVALVRQFGISEKDLPFCIYQFSTKFRDELRARGGLLRAREFLMKDGYSFHANNSEFGAYYEKVAQCYKRIFERLDLAAHMVAADNGYMGGDYCHEFIVNHSLGESRYLTSKDGTYCAHEDIATFLRELMNPDEELKTLTIVNAERGASVEAGVRFYGKPAWRQIKSIIYYTDQGEPVMASLRGDLDINEAKLAHILACNELRLATEQEVSALGSVVGFVSPLKLKIRTIGDLSLNTVRNFSTGADEWQRDTINVNYGRDFTCSIIADIAVAKEGHLSVGSKSSLFEQRGIEVGNIFQLGTWYSERMKGAEFTASSGKKMPYFMGCYGIGIGRTVATIAELHHDERGLSWPEVCSPYDIHLICIGNDESSIKHTEIIYSNLKAQGKSVLLDDRNVSAGVKLADAELLGISKCIIISKRLREARQAEVRYRHNGKVEIVDETQLESF